MTGPRAGARLAILTAMIAVAPAVAPAHAAGATALPAVATLGGASLPLASFRGKAVVVNFWASWCAPCRKELPSLDRLAAKRPDLVVIAASVDEDKQDGVRAFSGHYPHLHLGFASLAEVQRFGALGMPYSVVLDPTGREVARIPRALQWDGPDGAAVLRTASARQSASTSNRRR